MLQITAVFSDQDRCRQVSEDSEMCYSSPSNMLSYC